MINFFSFNSRSTHPVIYTLPVRNYDQGGRRADWHRLTTRHKGNFVQKVFNPSGADIWATPLVLSPERKRGEELTRLTKMIRSSSTPASLSTSTAFTAEPPVAF
jgi:hypothetical protein